MIALSTVEPVAWKPSWLRDGLPQRQYLFRPGSVLDRAALEADLAGECRAGPVFAFQLRAAFAEGVTALLADRPDYAAQLIELDGQEAALKKGEELPADERATLDQARDLLTEAWPAYAALIKQEERRNQFAPILCFRRFCVGWEGEGLPPFSRGLDGLVTLEAMQSVPQLDLRGGGLFAWSLLYGTGEAGNSARPSKRDDGQATSNSRKPPKAGESARRTPKARKPSGRRTRSSPSRTGRSRR